jgi:hypothetical protein
MHLCPRAARATIAVLTTSALAITACGGGGGTKATPTSSPKATPTSSPVSSAGVAIEGDGADVAGKVVNQGGTSTATATLKAGTYTFFCTVDNHRQAGMEGKLTVK